MAIRIPKNIIVESKYTIGGEFILLSLYQQYQGYYYEMNGKYFAGKEFDQNAVDFVKARAVNPKIIPLHTTQRIVSSVSGGTTGILYDVCEIFQAKQVKCAQYAAKKLGINTAKCFLLRTRISRAKSAPANGVPKTEANPPLIPITNSIFRSIGWRLKNAVN